MRSTVRSIMATLALAAISAVPVQAQAQSTNTRALASDIDLHTLASTPTAVALRYRAPMPPRLASATPSERVTESPAPTPSGFASTGFAQFMSSPAGRIARVVAGAGMIAGGIAMDSDGGTVLAATGGVPLLAGTFDFCILSPLFGGPFWGKDIRAAK